MKTLTIEQTLHPELVDSGDENSGSPWETFFREARGDIPIAIAEPVHEDLVATNTVTEDHIVNAEVVVSAKHDDDGFPPTPISLGQEEPRRQRNPGKGCFYLEGLIGGVLTLAVTLIVFTLELAGAIVYVLAVGFNVVASDERITPGLIQAIFSLVVHTLMLTDSVCLFCSVIITEVLAVATSIIMLILCALSGDCVDAASQWHQYIRKMSHLARWSFRSFHHGWKPQRVFPWDLRSDGPRRTNNNGEVQDNREDEEATVIHASTVSFVVEDEHISNDRSSLYRGSHVSLARAPHAPGESGCLDDALHPPISPVMSDEVIVVDVEHRSLRISESSKEKK